MNTARRSLIIANPSTIRLPLPDPDSVPLPGTETAALALADGMSRRGWSVRYFGNVAGHGRWRDTSFHPIAELISEQAATPADTCVWVRTYGLGHDLRARWTSTKHVLWSGDSLQDTHALQHREAIETSSSIANSLQTYDQIVTVSEHQRREWLGAFNPSVPTASIYNLVPDPRGIIDGRSRRDPVALNASNPRKSLIAFCMIARAAQVSDTAFQFRACHHSEDDGNSSAVVAPIGGDRRIQFDSLASLQRRYDGAVAFVPPYAAADRSASLREATVFLHPDHTGETGCSALIDAVKHGLVPITSEYGALPELVGTSGRICHGLPTSVGFIAQAVRHLQDVAANPTRDDSAMDRFGCAPLLDRWASVLAG